MPLSIPPGKTQPTHTGYADIGSLTAAAKRIVTQQSLEPCSLNGIPFWVNPTSIHVRTERIHTLMPTMQGVIRFSYGTRPMMIVMDGMTGLGGLQYLKHWDSLRPMHGNPDDPIAFKYPPRFGQEIIEVHIDWVEDSMVPDAPLFHFYSMQMIHLDPKLENDFSIMDHTPEQLIDVFTPSNTPSQVQRRQ